MTAPAPRPRTANRQRPQKGKGKTPARQQNGYYADHTTGDRLRSVTTIIGGGIPKEALTFWAANTCTDAAIDALPQLVAHSRNPQKMGELRDWITRAHTRRKDERADVGSAVHKIIEARILGTPLPESVMVGRGDDAVETRLDGPELKPFVDNIFRFIEDWQVEFTASEMVVANYTSQYAGTLDFMIADGLIADALRRADYDVPEGVDLMGDTKTGGDWDRITTAGHVHGVYPEAGIQMSAYRRGEQCWLRDGTKVPMPATAEVGIVLHLRPEGYRIYPARCGDDIFPYFQHAQIVAEWTSKVASAKAASPVIGSALKLPRRSTRKVA